MDTPAKFSVLGVGISATSYGNVCALVDHWVANRSIARKARYICVTSVHGVVTARRSPAVMKALNEADLATPDGMPVVWALRSFGVKDQARVYGPDLMLHLCEMAEKRERRIFLYGVTEEVLGELRQRLLRRFPLLAIAGWFAPPFRPLTPAEFAQVKASIEESRADLLFIGISSPKQDQWMLEHRDDFPGLVMVGVGAAFDFHAGRVRQAPLWMRSHGLEWLYRLGADPVRLWKRYLLVTPQFLPLWALQWLRFHAYRRSHGT